MFIHTPETSQPEIYRYHDITHLGKIGDQPRCRDVLGSGGETQAGEGMKK